MQRIVASTFVLSLGLLLATPVAWSQQYTSLQVDETAKGLRYKALQHAKSGSGAAEEYAKYIKGYALPKLTDARPQGLAELGKLRYELFRDFILGSEPGLQKQFTDLLFAEMQKVAGNSGGQFHPAVRYNAVLIIGLLDSTYADDRAQRPAVPHPGANQFLTNVLKAGLAQGRIPAPLVAGSLVGLERHAAVLSSLPAANQTATIDALVSMITIEKVPFEVSSSVEQYMRLMAARGLAATKSLGTANKHHEALFHLINNKDVKLNVRCQAAELLANLSEAYKTATGLDERQVTQALLQLASDVAADERQRALDYEKKTIRGLDVGSNYDVPLPDPYQIRRTVMRLRGVMAALNSAGQVVKDAGMKQSIDTVKLQVRQSQQLAETKDVLPLELAKQVKTMANEIEAVAGQAGVQAVEPAPAEEEEEEEAADAPTLQPEAAP